MLAGYSNDNTFNTLRGSHQVHLSREFGSNNQNLLIVDEIREKMNRLNQENHRFMDNLVS